MRLDDSLKELTDMPARDRVNTTVRRVAIDSFEI